MEGRVRFAESPPSPPPPPTAAGPSSAPGELHVHLGLLLTGGLYVTDLLPPSAAPAAALVRGLEVSNLSVGEEARAGGAHVLTLHLSAEQEGPFSTAFHLELPGQEPREVTVHVTATVMSRRKGTPKLKENVRCVGYALETDTDAS